MTNYRLLILDLDIHQRVVPNRPSWQCINIATALFHRVSTMGGFKTVEDLERLVFIFESLDLHPHTQSVKSHLTSVIQQKPVGTMCRQK